MSAISYSQVSQWLKCPLALKLKREHAPSEEPKIMQVGKLAHAIYEAYFRHCLSKNTETDIFEIRNIARAVYDKSRADYVSRSLPYLSEGEYNETYRTLVRPFVDTHMVNLADIAGVEDQVAVYESGEICDWDDTEAWFRGVFDVVRFTDAETCVVTDYKAGFNLDLEQDQLDIYAWLTFTLFPHIQQVICEFDFTRFNIQKTFEYNREQYHQLDTWLRDIVRRIKDDTEFLPAPGRHCMTCLYASRCTHQCVQMNAIHNLDDANQVVENLAIYDRDMKQQKELLREWCVANGFVSHNGVTWGFHEYGGLGFNDAEAFVTACKQEGIKSPYQYLSVNGTKIKKLKDKATGSFIGALATVAEDKKTLRFCSKKTKGLDEEDD